jgi:hypothetical protein
LQTESVSLRDESMGNTDYEDHCFWDIMPYSLAEMCHHFWDTCCLHLHYCSLIMEAAVSSETLETFCQTIRSNIPEDCALRIHRRSFLWKEMKCTIWREVEEGFNFIQDIRRELRGGEMSNLCKEGGPKEFRADGVSMAPKVTCVQVRVLTKC